MKLEELKLKKEELPILHGTCFQVPIHPKLLEPNRIIPDDLAPIAFAETVGDWYKDLKKYRDTANLEDQTKNWYDNFFLKGMPIIEKKGIHQSIMSGVWIDEYITQENGFARCLEINRNVGGSLYFPGSGGLDCEALLYTTRENISYIKFSPQKAKEFGFKEFNIEAEKCVNVYIYGQHNIDHYHGALFLRNWAINYMNKAFEFISD
ncbi:MAG: hypothetical protein Q7S27_01340 [Nanoarchaeota archaeon]|nr:hypothetical protein [Nanoarchaeota archaeon]